jgi:hypothetical protein
MEPTTPNAIPGTPAWRSLLRRALWRHRALPGGSQAIALVLFASPTFAQEALRSALSLDQLIAARTSSSGDSASAMRLGPFTLGVGAYSRASYDDNINLSTSTALHDVSVAAGLQARAAAAFTDQSDLALGGAAGYVRYLRNTRTSGLEISPDSSLAYSLSYVDATLTVYDQVAYSRQVVSEGALANLSTLPRLENTVGARMSWRPGRWVIEPGYGHEDFLPQSGAFQYLARSSEYGFARAGWGFAERTEAGVESSVAFSSFRHSPGNNNRATSIGGYVDWQVRPYVRVVMRGGPSFTRFDATGGSSQPTLESYYLGFELHHELSDFLSHQVILTRDVQSGLNQGSSYIEQLRATYSLSYKLTSSMTLGAALTWEDGTQPLAIPIFSSLLVVVPESFTRYTVTPSFSWRLTDHLTGSLVGTHSVRASNISFRRYQDNTVSTQLTYTF